MPQLSGSRPISPEGVGFWSEVAILIPIASFAAPSAPPSQPLTAINRLFPADCHIPLAKRSPLGYHAFRNVQPLGCTPPTSDHPPGRRRFQGAVMATFVRNRVLNQLQWAPETDTYRSRRREILCELDGLLVQIEEMNLRGQPLPPRVFAQLRRRGVPVPAEAAPADLVEAIFAAQERFMRQPLGGLPGREALRLRGQLAS